MLEELDSKIEILEQCWYLQIKAIEINYKMYSCMLQKYSEYMKFNNEKLVEIKTYRGYPIVINEDVDDFDFLIQLPKYMINKKDLANFMWKYERKSKKDKYRRNAFIFER